MKKNVYIYRDKDKMEEDIYKVANHWRKHVLKKCVGTMDSLRETRSRMSAQKTLKGVKISLSSGDVNVREFGRGRPELRESMIVQTLTLFLNESRRGSG